MEKLPAAPPNARQKKKNEKNEEKEKKATIDNNNNNNKTLNNTIPMGFFRETNTPTDAEEIYIYIYIIISAGKSDTSSPEELFGHYFCKTEGDMANIYIYIKATSPCTSTLPMDNHIAVNSRKHPSHAHNRGGRACVCAVPPPPPKPPNRKARDATALRTNYIRIQKKERKKKRRENNKRMMQCTNLLTHSSPPIPFTSLTHTQQQHQQQQKKERREREREELKFSNPRGDDTEVHQQWFVGHTPTYAPTHRNTTINNSNNSRRLEKNLVTQNCLFLLVSRLYQRESFFFLFWMLEMLDG
eukprot:gene12367-8493_t